MDTYGAGIPDAEDRIIVQNDRDEGRFFAFLPDGITLIGRPGSKKHTVRYMDHQMMVEWG